MIVKWIQSMTQRGTPTVSEGGTSPKASEAAEQNRVFDVAHESLRRDQEQLDGLVRMGWPLVKREQLKGKVRKKVWDAIGSDLPVMDEGMVEEITERVVDAAEFDPYYSKMFEIEEDAQQKR